MQWNRPYEIKSFQFAGRTPSSLAGWDQADKEFTAMPKVTGIEVLLFRTV